MVSRLSAMHTRTVLLTGDNQKTADYFAQQVGISEVRAQLLPEEKVGNIEALRESGRKVCMIGDGVKDVKALRESDCSISFASANEVARNISRIILTDNDFGTLPVIVNEGRSVIGNIEKVSALYIMKNIAIMVLTLAFAIAGFIDPTISYPLSTKQLLLIEFFFIGVPSLAFAMK